jgi:hypothetical protein
MQYASAPYVITEEEDSKDKKVGDFEIIIFIIKNF